MSLPDWFSAKYLAVGALIVGTKLYFRGARCTLSPNLKGKVAIVTGSNVGIGYCTALRLSELGATVILACRDPERTQVALENIKNQTKSSSVEFIKLDLGNKKSIQDFVNQFKEKHDRLDILVNNAGIMNFEKKFTIDSYEETFGVNYLGPFMLTELLNDRLTQSAPSRVINVSSDVARAGKIDFDDLMNTKNFNPLVAYANSKFAQTLYTQELHRRYESLGIKAVALEPGMVKTEIFRGLRNKKWASVLSTLLSPFAWLIMKTPMQGAQTTLHCCLVDHDKLVGGGFYSECKESNKVNPALYDAELSKKLCEESVKLLELEKDEKVSNS